MKLKVGDVLRCLGEDRHRVITEITKLGVYYDYYRANIRRHNNNCSIEEIFRGHTLLSDSEAELWKLLYVRRKSDY